MIRIVFALVFCTVFHAGAETRIWTINEEQVEAEFIRMSGSTTVVLQSDDSDQRLSVRLVQLSAKDLEYIADTVLPEIKIKVNIDRNRHRYSDNKRYSNNNNYSDTSIELVRGEIGIRKTSKTPSSRNFTAHVFFLAENPDLRFRSVIGYSAHRFSFKEGDKVEFKTAMAETRHNPTTKRIRYSRDLAGRYEGYLVVVIDDRDGDILATRSNYSIYEKHIIKFFPNGTPVQEQCVFDHDFDIVQRGQNKRNKKPRR